MKVKINALGVIELTPETQLESFALTRIKDSKEIDVRYCTKDQVGIEYLQSYTKR